MARKDKLKTPEWILEGYDSKEEFDKKNKKKSSSGKKKKIFKIRKCPKCGSENIGVILGLEEGKGKGEWKCNDCGWEGKNVVEEELGEEQFLNYLDKKN